MKSKEERKKDKQKKRNKWQMNRELYLCSLLMLAVFAGMIWYLADYVSSNQEALFNNSYNSQQRVLAQENTRGTIYAGTGEVLAQTVTAEDGTSVREYPYKNTFAHVVGYTDKGKTADKRVGNGLKALCCQGRCRICLNFHCFAVFILCQFDKSIRRGQKLHNGIQQKTR